MASAIIETFFSKTSYIKSKTRKSLSDKKVSHVLHVSQTPPPVDVERLPTDAISIDVTVAARRTENDLDTLRDKYMGRKITREFRSADGRTFTQYKGVVDQVYWEPELRKFIFHVVYCNKNSSTALISIFLLINLLRSWRDWLARRCFDMSKKRPSTVCQMKS